jgi:hypothetical protein
LCLLFLHRTPFQGESSPIVGASGSGGNSNQQSDFLGAVASRCERGLKEDGFCAPAIGLLVQRGTALRPPLRDLAV